MVTQIHGLSGQMTGAKEALRFFTVSASVSTVIFQIYLLMHFYGCSTYPWIAAWTWQSRNRQTLLLWRQKRNPLTVNYEWLFKMQQRKFVPAILWRRNLEMNTVVFQQDVEPPLCPKLLQQHLAGNRFPTFLQARQSRTSTLTWLELSWRLSEGIFESKSISRQPKDKGRTQGKHQNRHFNDFSFSVDKSCSFEHEFWVIINFWLLWLWKFIDFYQTWIEQILRPCCICWYQTWWKI